MVGERTTSTSSLEVVSEERFQQRLEGMATGAAGGCMDCLRERARHGKGQSSRRYRKLARTKRNTPIVVRLRDTIKVSILSKMAGGAVGSDWDATSSSSCSSGAEDSSSTSSSTSSTPRSVRRRNKAQPSSKPLPLTQVDSASQTPHSPAVVVNVGRHLKHHAASNKNFNAFLSAIEKVHMKDLKGGRHLLAKNSLEQYSNMAACMMPSGKDGTPLNNMLTNEAISSKARSLELLDADKIELICNDLHSDLYSSTDPGEISDDTDIASTSDSSGLESTVDMTTDSEDGGKTLSKEELDKLREYAEGTPLTRYDCPPHECPQCLATYSAAYTHYYAHGTDMMHIELVDDCSMSSGTTSTEPSRPPSPISSSVTVIGPGKVEVSVAQILYNNNNSTKTSAGSKQNKGHRLWNQKKEKKNVGFDTVTLDLTDTNITYTVQCLEDYPSPIPGTYPDFFYYHFYWAMFGYTPVYSPRSAFYLTPAYYHTYPMVPVSPPASPLGRTTTTNATLCQPRHHQCVPCAGSAAKCLQSTTSGMSPPLISQPSIPHRTWGTTYYPAPDFRYFAASQPPQRPWIPLAHPETNRPIAIYTVMCYNVLCDKYATRQLYGYCPSWALNWEYRKKIILEEIRQYSADIISLQEVETEQFYNFFLPELKLDGYNGIFSPKSRARTMQEADRKHVDGCAIFYRTSKFGLIKEHLVEFNQLAISTAEGSHDMINRVMTKDNIGLAALLETKEGIWENGLPAETQMRQPILVATCHVHWDPEFCDVKLIQTMMLMNELKNIIEETQTSLRPGSTAPDSNSIPLILCGDLNSLPESGVVEYLTTGHVDANHRDFKELGYEECLRKLSNDQNKDIFAHAFKLSQAYNKEVMPYTNYTFDFKGIIDYIFYSRDFMRPLGLLGPLDQEWFRENKVFGCPHPQIPSDHLPLLVEFEMGHSGSRAGSGTGSSSSSSNSGSTNNTAGSNSSSGAGMHLGGRR